MKSPHIPSNPSWYRPDRGTWGEQYRVYFGSTVTSEGTQSEVESTIRLIGDPPRKILDLACGFGRHSVEFAKRGYEVVGLDNNQNFLALAKAKAREAGVRISFIKEDMRHIPFSGTFDAVVNLYNSFGYLETTREDEKVIRAITRSLHQGGYFVIYINNYINYLGRALPSSAARWDDGTLIFHERSFDPFAMILNERQTVIDPKGKRKENIITLRCYLPRDLRELCERNGLAFIDIYGDDLHEWSRQSSWMWMRFQKRAHHS